MSGVTVVDRIRGRCGRHHVGVDVATATALGRFYELLWKWNGRMNLTGLSDGDEALDRLIVEPVLAASRMPVGGQHLDVGSGGGSPALPVRIVRPAFRSVLVESRARKVAFLREAARYIPVDGVRVEACRVEALAASDRVTAGGAAFDLITLRAVRLDREMLDSIGRLARPGAVLWYFAGVGDVAVEHERWVTSGEVPLIEGRSRCLCFTWNAPPA